MNIPLHITALVCSAAFRLERVLMVSALGEYAQLYTNSPDAHSRSVISQNIELMANLLQSSDERFTYDLRITSLPNATTLIMGTIEIHVIIAMRCDAADAQTHAMSVYRLFNAHFRDLVWLMVEDVAGLLDGITVRHAVSLTRKSGFILTETHTKKGQSSFGMVKSSSEVRSGRVAQRERMFYICPFIHSESQPHELFDYLLQHPHQVSVSIRVQRTHLTADELRFCQENLATFDDVQNYPAAVAEQIATYQRIMNATLLRSFNMAALVNIDIVSATFVPEHLITLIGGLITQPAGGLFKTSESAAHPIQYHGGYDVIHHSDYLPIANALRTVQLRPIPSSLSPTLDRLPHIVDINEASMAFRIPRSSLVPLPGIKMQSNRQLRPPSGLSDTGTIVGEYHEHGTVIPIRLSEIDRTRHAYIIGQTGTGKSTVLKSMILDDINAGRGVCAIDPHGDLINDVLAQIPAHRRDDVIVVDPTQTDAPIGLNLFEYESQEEREIAVQLFQKTVELIEYGRGTKAEYMGPVFWQHLRNNAYWITQDAHDPGTIIELYNMYAIKDYYKRWQPFDENDGKLVNWNNIMTSNSYHRQGDDGHSSFSYFASKFEDFIFDTRLRLIFGQKRSTFNFYDVMNERKIVLINLSRGLLSEIASAFMGGVIMAKLQQAALKRAAMPAEARSLFAIYVDEFQNYTSDSFISLLSESRKYGIALTLANQFLSQIENPRIVSAILGNVGTVISFRVGIQDGDYLKPRFAPEVMPNDLINLPNWQAYVSTQVRGQSQRPFSMQTIRPLEDLDMQIRAAVIGQSKRRFGRVRAEVERMIEQSMSLKRVVEPKLAQVTHGFSLASYPITHEVIKQAESQDKQYVVHGAGLSLWSDYKSDTNTFPLRIGIHPHVSQGMNTMQLTDIQPYRQELGSMHAEFKEWASGNNVTSLAELRAIFNHETQIGVAPTALTDYVAGIHGYVMHQHQPAVAWVDAVLTKHLAAALDAQHRAYIWNNQYTPTAHIVDNVKAITGSEHHVFVLRMDGTVMRYTQNTVESIDSVRNIEMLYGGENFVAARNHNGKVYFIAEHEAFVVHVISDTPTDLHFAQVACGYDHVVAITDTNDVVTWGKQKRQGRISRIASWNSDIHAVPAEINTPNVRIVAVAAGNDVSFALDTTGKLYTWGRRHLKDETVQTLNYHGVSTIACYRDHFICQTNDGSWWHNDQPLAIPLTLASQYIKRIVANHDGDICVIRTPDPLVTLIGLNEVDINKMSGLVTDTRTALIENNVHTLYQLIQLTHDKLMLISYFAVREEARNQLIQHIKDMLQSLQLPTDWPTHAITVQHVVPNRPLYGWYFEPFGKDKLGVTSKDKDSFDFDDDFFNFLNDD